MKGNMSKNTDKETNENEEKKAVMVRLPKELAKRFQIKCIEMDKNQNEVMHRLISKWVDGDGGFGPRKGQGQEK